MSALPAAKLTAVYFQLWEQMQVIQRFSSFSLAGLFLFALCLWLSSAVAYLGLALMLVAFGFQLPGNWSGLKRDPLLVLFAAFLLFLGFQALWLQAADVSGFSFKQAWDWISLWLFFVTASALGGQEKQITRCLFLAVLGLMLRFGYEVVFEIGWEPFLSLIGERRYGFFFSVNEAGHNGSLLLFGFLIFLPRLVSLSTSKIAKGGFLIFWLIGSGLAVEILILSGSRSSWLGFLLVCLPFLPWVYSRSWQQQSKKLHWKRPLLLVFLLCLLSAGLIAFNVKGFRKNLVLTLENNLQLVQQLFKADFEALPFEKWDEAPVKSSIGRRILLGYYSWELIRERPWLGWGTTLNLPKVLSEKTGSRKIGERKHLHNGYLILLARFGIVGTALFGLAGFFLIRALVRAYRSRIISRDVYAFLLGSLLITALVSLVNFRWTQMDFRFLWLLLAGMAYAGMEGQRA